LISDCGCISVDQWGVLGAVAIVVLACIMHHASCSSLALSSRVADACIEFMSDCVCMSVRPLFVVGKVCLPVYRRKGCRSPGMRIELTIWRLLGRYR